MSHPLEMPPTPPNDDENAPAQPIITFIVENKQPYVAYGLIALNVVIFLIGTLSEATTEQLLINGALIPIEVLGNFQLHRLFTAMFLHANIAHLVLNMLALANLGTRIEQIYGHYRFITVYFLGGLLGSVLSAIIGDYSVWSVGASGAIFAVWGANFWLIVRHRHLFPNGGRELVTFELIFLVGNLLIGFNPANRVDNWAHIGGFLGGLALSYLIAPSYQKVTLKHPDGTKHDVALDVKPFTRQRLPLIGMYSVAVLAIFVLGMLVFRAQLL